RRRRTKLPIHRVLFDEREDVIVPARAREGVVGVAAPDDAARQTPGDVVIVVKGEPELLQVIGALHAIGRLAHLLHRGQQQADEDADDGDDDEELDQRESPPRSQALPGNALPRGSASLQRRGLRVETRTGWEMAVTRFAPKG